MIAPTGRRQRVRAENWDGLPIVTACGTVRRFGGLAVWRFGALSGTAAPQELQRKMIEEKTSLKRCLAVLLAMSMKGNLPV
jgi:hypothetical protein